MNQEEFFYKFGDKPKTFWHKIKWFLFQHFFREQIEVFTTSSEMPGYSEGYKQGFEAAVNTKNAYQHNIKSVLTKDFRIDLKKLYPAKNEGTSGPTPKQIS